MERDWQNEYLCLDRYMIRCLYLLRMMLDRLDALAAQDEANPER
jgi:hypothetical protein